MQLDQLSGLILLDKPINKLSHEVTSYVARLFNSKAGHAGTLDPNVSGVLPIAINRARKFLRFIAAKDKEYIGIAKFNHNVKKEEIELLFKKFEGIITQIPPKKSAVAKRKRKRRVFFLKPIEIFGNRVLFHTKVEKGTYIRVLCKDMNAYMEDLRRVAVGDIKENETINLQKLYILVNCFDKNKTLLDYIYNVDKFFNYPKVFLKYKAAFNVTNGSFLSFGGIEKFAYFKKSDIISLYYKNIFLGLGKALYNANEHIKGFVIKPLRMYRNRKEFLYSTGLLNSHFKDYVNIIFPKSS